MVTFPAAHEKLFAQKDIRIVVTDSGLGGLSVAADLYERLKSSKVFEHAEVIYFNAQPHLDSGYNMMRTTEEKVRVFDNALYAMENEFRPDVIFIACNTLAVIYDQTRFSRRARIPVIGIVETGVEIIHHEMLNQPDAAVAIFATETTIGQGRHKKLLMERGIPAAKIYEQACPDLAGAIERGADSPATVSLVRQYINELTEKLRSPKDPLIVSYNCTHYGYADPVFRKVFSEKNVAVTCYLNPNLLMADFIFDPQYRERYHKSTATIRIVSQAELIPQKMKSIQGLIKPQSAGTSGALPNYEFVPDLFEWRFVTE
jgi:glutamate racemase